MLELTPTSMNQPDPSQNIDSPFTRDGTNELVLRSYWLDLVMVMVSGIGANLTLMRGRKAGPSTPLRSTRDDSTKRSTKGKGHQGFS